MKTIFKYPIALIDRQIVRAVWNAKPIHAGLDPDGQPCVWCEVESGNTDREPLEIFMVGTGQERPDRASKHLGSFVQYPFVWHIYTAN